MDKATPMFLCKMKDLMIFVSFWPRWQPSAFNFKVSMGSSLTINFTLFFFTNAFNFFLKQQFLTKKLNDLSDLKKFFQLLKTNLSKKRRFLLRNKINKFRFRYFQVLFIFSFKQSTSF